MYILNKITTEMPVKQFVHFNPFVVDEPPMPAMVRVSAPLLAGKLSRLGNPNRAMTNFAN